MHQNLLSQLLAVNDTVGRKAAPSIVICSTVDSFAVSFLQGIEGIKDAMFECGWLLYFFGK